MIAMPMNARKSRMLGPELDLASSSTVSSVGTYAHQHDCGYRRNKANQTYDCFLSLDFVACERPGWKDQSTAVPIRTASSERPRLEANESRK